AATIANRRLLEADLGTRTLRGLAECVQGCARNHVPFARIEEGIAEAPLQVGLEILKTRLVDGFVAGRRPREAHQLGTVARTCARVGTVPGAARALPLP